MQNKIKNIVITIGFTAILITMLLANILKKPQEISVTERRKLAQFPKITFAKLLSGDVADKLEKYTTDQFIARDSFRTLKSFFSINVLGKKDNNNLFKKDDAIYKMEYPLKEENIARSMDKINDVYNKYLKGKDAYFAIIPDKNYYLKNDDHLKFDYNKLKQISLNKLNNLNYIDIWGDLKLEDYYRTDLHWKQENLQNVSQKILNTMGQENVNSLNYTKVDVGEFYGTYYGQLGLKVKPDKMYILTNDVIKECETYKYETKSTGTIYDTKISNDKYDIYLSGATPLISIENKNANTEKELLLFRDSFGSSIAPLLIQNYKKITLIDLRYMSSKLLDSYIEFGDQDVLFLYSTVVLNQNVFK